MTKMDEIKQEIEKLEAEDSLTYGIINKLAMLYIVRDKMREPVSSPTPAPAMPTTNTMMK